MSNESITAGLTQRQELRGPRSAFTVLDTRELPLVHRFAVPEAGAPYRKWSALWLNGLGNGWIYLPVGIALLVLGATPGWRTLLVAGAAAAPCPGGDAVLTRTGSRPRPSHLDPGLATLVDPLDAHSFPSGHCMTATAVGIPLSMAFPVFASVIVLFIVLLAWSRIALGHHYPSDVLAGCALGACVAMPLSLLLLP